MVTVKFTKEEYDQLQNFLMAQEDNRILSTLNEVYYGNSKRSFEEKDSFDKKIFDTYRKEKITKDHNEALSKIKIMLIKAIDAGASVAAIPFEEKEKRAFEGCRETLISDGFDEDAIEIRKVSLYDRWKLKTDKSHLIVINF